MAKYIDNNTVVSAAFNAIKTGTTTLVLCSSMPTGYSDISTKALATKAVTATGWAVSNNVLTIPSITGISITTGGTVRAFVLTNGSSIMYLGDYCAGSTDGATGGTAVTAGQVYDLASCTLTVNQPT